MKNEENVIEKYEEDLMDETNPTVTNSEEESISLDGSFFENDVWINMPKEIDEVSEEFEILKFIKRPGKLVKANKEKGIKTDFWSGLKPQAASLKDCETEPTKYPEYIVVGKNAAGQEVKHKLSSWEAFFKWKNFGEYCKEEGIRLSGMKMSVKRLNKGAQTAGENMEMYFSRGKDKYVVAGEDNEISKL